MRALQILSPGPLSETSLVPRDVSLPDLAPGQVLLRVRACGVCHTDLHLVEGELAPRRLPFTPGHQVVAVVERAGAAVTRCRPGERVGVPWLHTTCGACDHCRRGESNLCGQAHFTGWDVDGGYAEQMVADQAAVVPLPEACDDLHAAPLLCAGIIGYRSLRLAGLQPGERLGLYGFGASAHLAIQLARHWGCRVSVFTRSPEHRALAEAMGAAWVGGAGQSPPEPLDRAVIFAPSGRLVPLALSHLRRGGVLAVNAIHMSAIPEMDYALLYGERCVRSVANATHQDAVEFMRLAAEIPVTAEVEAFPLAEAAAALRRLKHSQIDGAAVLIP